MKNIILIGFMACGKSSVGRRLSQAIDLEFLDTDSLIEQKAGTSISDIFSTQGEPAACRPQVVKNPAVKLLRKPAPVLS